VTHVGLWIEHQLGSDKVFKVHLPPGILPDHRRDPFLAKDMESWCMHNCTDDWWITPYYAAFKSESDALMFRLIWCCK